MVLGTLPPNSILWPVIAIALALSSGGHGEAVLDERAATLDTYKRMKRIEQKILAELDLSSSQLARLKEEMVQTRTALENSNRRLNELEAEQVKLEAKLAPLRKTVRRRLQARQRSLREGQALLRLLLHENGPNQFLRSRGYLNSIAEMDLALISDFQVQARSITASQEKLFDSRLQLEQLESELVEQTRKLDLLNERRFNLLEQAKQEKRQAEIIARQLGIAATSLQGGDENSPALAKGLSAPMTGAIVRGFGTYTQTDLKTKHNSSGWHIVGPSAAPIHAIAEGKIIYSGWFKGYGNLIVIEHSPSIHSIYGGLSRIDVSTKEMVKTDQPIGRGPIQTSQSNRGVYFEIRRDKMPINPSRYVTKMRGKID